MKVAITGSSGLIGTALTASLRADGHQVVRLVRRPPHAADEVRWDPRAADAGDPLLTGVDACVHLAGAGVGDHRWTAAYKAEIRSSRVLPDQGARRGPGGGFAAPGGVPGRLRDRLVRRHRRRPGGPRTPRPARRSCSRVVADWEAAAAPAREAGIRVAHLRSGLVLASGGGVLGRLALPARLGVLPRFGDGRQVMSWISLTDEVRAIRFLLDDPGAEGRSGPYNLTAPNPVTDSELTAALHAAFHRPDFPLAARPRPAAQAGPGRDVGRAADQRPRPAEAPAGRRLRLRAPDRGRRPRGRAPLHAAWRVNVTSGERRATVRSKWLWL